jgi:hypothetical protein
MRPTTELSLGRALVAVGIAAGSASAQSTVAPERTGLPLPPIRPLGAVKATARETFTILTQLRPLSDGRVLVNDPAGRRVLLYDEGLANFTVVADSTSATSNAYSGRFAGLIGYKADSTLFVDPQSLSMLVLDPTGKVGRVMSVPSAQDAPAFAGMMGGTAVDANGRLVYRASPRFEFRRGPGAAGGPPGIPDMPDSAAIFRIDLATRQIDTVGYIKIPKLKMNMSQDENGRVRMTSEVNPLPQVDDWAVLSDGSVALVRGRDYHVDWVNPDGTRSSSPKIPFEWRRLTDEDKVAFIDSVKAARERMGANAPMVMGPGVGATVIAGGPPPGAAGAEQRMVITMGAAGAAAGGPPPAGGAQRGAAGSPGPNFTAAQVNFIPPSELPDYQPPFLANSTRADAQGNIWIRTIPTKAIKGGPVYDVVNRKGELVERVQVPEGRTIVAFAPNGDVYMTFREGQTTKLEKATWR